MSNLEGIPSADVKGTGWRVSGSSGRRWYRIEKGSPDFEQWKSFYRKNGKADFAAVIDKCGYSFVLGPSPMQHGDMQLAFLNQAQSGSK